MAHERNSSSRVRNQSPRGNATPSEKLKHSRSLVISPNLDALLEFEERHREAISAGTSPTALGDDLPSLGPDTPGSLPPPPRGPRGSKSLPVCKGEPSAMWRVTQNKHMPGTPLLSISSSESNPYINPAPTLEELLSEDSQLIDSDVGLQWKSARAEDNMLDTSDGRTLAPQPDAGCVTTGQSPCSELAGTDLRPKLPRIITDVEELNSHGQGTHHLLPPLFQCADSMFNFLNLSSSDDQKRHSADYHSFIDLLSPTQPDTVFSRLTNTINDANVCNSPISKSAPGSPRPLLPATPKSLFSHSTPFKNYRKTPHPMGTREYSGSALPPTTNSLGTDKRADLVRKTRKLAHVFGQPPEAGVLLLAMSQQVSNVPSRRHSLPLTLASMSTKSGDPMVADITKLHSPVSFIDLSDDDDTLSAIIPAPLTGRRRRSFSCLPENISPGEQAEEERRRKREKLAKLHRFLGSQVPASLALGLDDPDTTLPPERMSSLSGCDEPSRKIWMKRRSSCVTESPCPWTEDLGNKEKAINVKRAQKMEKVFGVAPPQTLFHTRHTPSPTLPSVADTSPQYQRNPNRTAYTKNRVKNVLRPTTSESRQALLPKGPDSMQDFPTSWSPLGAKSEGKSKVYTHYQHSLNSVQDILDRVSFITDSAYVL
ncbi:hypothetical protein AX15_004035 [Amanita polypyramis BW_CC]|nr:hypothetical protein AX15_004035 [Amanita polypyramis BW_CC]